MCRLYWMDCGDRRSELTQLTQQRVFFFYVACILCLVKTPFSQGSSCNVKDNADNEDNGDEGVPFLQAVLQADVVLYGQILNTYRGHQFPDVYTAEMEVFCFIKGPAAGRVLNISEAGYVPGACHTTELHRGKIYVVLANFTGSRYLPTYTEKPGTLENVNDVAKACRIDPKYPIGVNGQTTAHGCPTAAPPGKCIDESYFTTVTTATTTEPSTTICDYLNQDYECQDGSLGVSEFNTPASSKSPSLIIITSLFSTSSTDYRLILSIRLLSAVLLNLLYKVFGTCLVY